MNIPDKKPNWPAKQSHALCNTADMRLLSELIGQIYDCALAPERWEQTLTMICEGGNFLCAAINLFDRQNKSSLIQQCSGVEDYWLERYSANEDIYGAEIYHIRSAFFEKLSSDAPMALSRHVPREAYVNMRYYQEWMRPQGLVDIMQFLVMRQPHRMGAITFARHERWGLINDHDMVLGAFLLPHLCRAITISNLLETKSLHASNLRTIIENLSIGILLIAEDGAILEANAAAEQLLNDGQIIRARRGCLAATRPGQGPLLSKAILLAAQENSIAGGVTLSNAQGGFITAHVLPLTSGIRRSSLHRTAVAAIFLSPDSDQFAKIPRADLLGTVYKLTAAEKRVAEVVSDGKTSLEAALTLGISEATMRSHLTRIFAKTGVARQTELISLMYRLAHPLRDIAKAHEKER
jgi:DNA-binding CsgD family transcriptional regulator/PAS domain-containing protein